MVDQRDIDLSRRLRDLAEKLSDIVTAELGEPHLFGLVIQPYSRDGSGEDAEFQYISNGSRDFMHGALKALVEKWDAGAPSIPPHEKQ